MDVNTQFFEAMEKLLGETTDTTRNIVLNKEETAACAHYGALGSADQEPYYASTP